MLIMLRTDWPGDTFRRAGLVFQRGVPVDVDNATLLLIDADITRALVVVNPTTAKADHDASAEICKALDAFRCRVADSQDKSLDQTILQVIALHSPKPTTTDEPAPAAASPAEPTSAAETTMAEPPPKRRR